MMKLKAIWFAVLSAAVFFSGMPSRAENPVKASPDKFSLAVECVKRFEGWHGEKKHWPYVGWGHKVLPGERFTNGITKAQGDSILRADLRKLCRMFSYLGRDSLLLSEISDNNEEPLENSVGGQWTRFAVSMTSAPKIIRQPKLLQKKLSLIIARRKKRNPQSHAITEL